MLLPPCSCHQSDANEVVKKFPRVMKAPPPNSNNFNLVYGDDDDDVDADEKEQRNVKHFYNERKTIRIKHAISIRPFYF